jgi:RNA polymerase sigma factor (sigma-70 family)
MSASVPSSGGWCNPNSPLSSESDDRDQYFSQAHWKRTYRHAYSVVGNAADAEDAAQEAYLRLYEAVVSGRKIESLVSWMKSVVRNVVVDQFRKARPDLHIGVEEDDNSDNAKGILAELADPATSVEERLSNESLVLESLRVLAELPERDRECVMMYARGCTFVQIANVLNMPYEVAIKTTRKALVKTRRRIGR